MVGRRVGEDEWVVRQVGEDEWERLRDLRLAALRTDADAFGSSLAREEGFRETHWRMRLRSSPWLVAGSDGAPDGLVCVIAEPGAPADVRHLVSLWVRPESRGSGVGRALVDAATELARADGATAVTLWLVDGNAAGAALYRSCGFRPTGERTALVRDPDRQEERWILDLT